MINQILKRTRSAATSALNRQLARVGAQLTPKIDTYALQRDLLRDRQTVTARDGQEARTVIFDVGASDGRTARRYRTLFADAHIYCFEPNPDRAEPLTEAHHPNTYVYDYAVSDTDGETTFFCNEDPDTDSLLKSNVLGSHIDKYSAPRQERVVKTRSLDSFCQENGIDHISILKLDIQGGELLALRGAERLLRERRVDLIFTEVEFLRIYAEQPLYHHIAAHLEGYGYHAYGLYDLVPIERRRIAWCDAIFYPAGDTAAPG